MRMRYYNWFMVATWLCLVAGFAWAQTATVTTTTTVPLLPTDPAGMWTWVIALTTPVIVHYIKTWIASVPKWVLPLLTPVIGILLGCLVNWLTRKNIAWIDLAQAGGLAVLVRETVNQVVTKRLATSDADEPAEDTKPSTPDKKPDPS